MKKFWMKPSVLAAAVVAAILCAGLIGYMLRYPVRGDNSNLPDQAARFLRHGASVPAAEEIKVYDSVSMGKEKFVLMEYVQAGEPQLGIIRMIKGVNGQYKIESISYGGGNFREEVVETNYQKYYLFGGRNTHFGITEARIILEGRTYRLEIPQQDYFLLCEEIDYTIRDTHCDLERLIFYNEDGRDITDQVPWD